MEVAGVFFCFQIQMKFNNWTFRLCCRSNKGKGMITFWCQTFFGAPLIEKCCLNNYSFDLVGNQSHSDKCRKKILNYCHTSRFSLIKGTQPEEWGVHRGTNWAAIPHTQSIETEILTKVDDIEPQSVSVLSRHHFPEVKQRNLYGPKNSRSPWVGTRSSMTTPLSLGMGQS